MIINHFLLLAYPTQTSLKAEPRAHKELETPGIVSKEGLPRSE